METQTAFIRTDRGIEFHTVSAVDLHFAIVIHPRYAEDDLTFRLNDPLEDSVFDIFRVLLCYWLQRSEYFGHCLNEFLVVRIALDHAIQDWF